MTKESFEKFDKTKDIYCECCKQNKPTSSFNYRSIKTNIRSANRCKACDWLYRHYNGNIPNIKGFTHDEILQTVLFIFDNNNPILNELSFKLNRTIDELIELIYALNLKNVPLTIQSKCACCKQNINSKISVYLNRKNLYCSLECYWKDKTNKVPHGENSPYYNRIITNCTNCRKEIKVLPNKYNTKNHFGDNHNFCSHKCYSEYRSKYYKAEKASMYHYKYSDEQKEENRIRMLDRMKDDNRLETSIQITIDNLLFDNQINFEREKVFDYYAIDNYLCDSNGIIEVMGDYWHTTPLIYNEDNRLINEMQQKQLHRDKTKYSYIINHYQIPILYLWETDIKQHPDMCLELIKKYIQNNRILENYHSFNWQLENTILSIKGNIIVPYQDMSVNEYRHLIKKKVG